MFTMAVKRTAFLCLSLLHLMLGSLTAARDARESVESSKEPWEGRQATCTPKEVTVRDVYLALNDISGKCETLSLLLNINKGVLGNIDKDCHRDNDCKYQRVIQAWYNGRVNPSWDELVTALEKMGEKVLARDIQMKYLCFKESPTLFHNTPENLLTNSSSLGERLNHLVKEFEEMVDDFEDHLLQNPPDLDIFNDRVLRLLRPYASREQFNHLKGFMDDIVNQAGSVGKLMIFFHTHMFNFFQYEIFDSIVTNFGNKELQKRLESYINHVSEFQRVTTLSEFFQLWSNIVEPPKEFVAYTIKFRKTRPDNMTLEQVEGLRKKQAKKYYLPTHVFKFASGTVSVQHQYVTLTWFVWTTVATEILQIERNTTDFLDNEDLLYFSVGNTVLFNFESVTQLLLSILNLIVPILSALYTGIVWIMDLYRRKKHSLAAPKILNFVSVAIVAFIFLAGVYVGTVVDLKCATKGGIIGTYTGIIGLIVGVIAGINVGRFYELFNHCILIGPTAGVLAGATDMSGMKIGITAGMAIGCSGMKFVRYPMSLLMGAMFSGALMGTLAESMALSTCLTFIIRVRLLAVVARVIVLISTVSAAGFGATSVQQTVELMENAMTRKKCLIGVFFLAYMHMAVAIIGTLILGEGMSQLLIFFPVVARVNHAIITRIVELVLIGKLF